MLKKALLLFLTVFSVHSAYAKVTPLAHYNFGRSGNVTYALAPETIVPIREGFSMKAIGRPVFYADAPEDKALKGEGSILFNGLEDGYAAEKSYSSSKENLLLEIWVKARVENLGQENSPKEVVVVANGTKTAGYQLVQRGGQWILISGGIGSVVVGEVLKNQWVHLALMVEDEKARYGTMGRKQERSTQPKHLDQTFPLPAMKRVKATFMEKSMS